MGLFKIPQRQQVSDKEIITKSTSVKKANTVSLKGSGSLFTRIQSISNLVQTKLGKHKDSYDVIRNEPEKLHRYIDACIANRYYALDTETTGLNPMLDELEGFSIYTPGQKAVYVPINHVSYITMLKADNQLDISVVKSELQRLEDNNVRCIMFNAPFDIRVIWSHTDVRLHCYWDCYIATRLLNENEPSNALKELYNKYIEPEEDEAWTFGKLFSDVTFSLIPIKDAYIYGARDAEVTYRYFEYQRPFLTLGTKECEEHNLQGPANVMFNIEMPVMDAFIDMEQTGILLDIEYTKELSKKYHDYVDKSRANVDSILKELTPDIEDYKRTHLNSGLENPINVGSNKQLSCLIYDILKIPIVDERNPRGVGKEILERIDHPLCRAILEQRKFEKLLSTYIDKMPEIANPNDGRIHCKFNQMGAATGRTSSNDPKQNANWGLKIRLIQGRLIA